MKGAGLGGQTTLEVQKFKLNAAKSYNSARGTN
jgi:hypothetical protein